MSKSPLVPTKFFRESVHAIYAGLLADVGVKARNITVHVDSSATLNLASESDADTVLGIEGMEALTDYTVRGNMRVIHDTAIDFLESNSPKSGKVEKSAGGGRREMTPEREAELERRRATKERLNRLLAEHGFDREGDERDE